MDWKKIIISTLILLVADLLWIFLWMGPLYKKYIPRIQNSPLQINMVWALGSYILMVLGLQLFVMPRIRRGRELQDSLLYGLTFGLVLYGVYDLTAAAVIKNWNLGVALQDILWGGFVFFLASYFGSIIV